ncbi:LITAF-like zinc ribbon domain-containing protein [Neorhizobium sp. P12A]|uniref:LITAF-like zinc ribbon domain-containing protein n=1 Tax=Neorhizobium sp. P12A TaxID=2268027 RepID=UPI0011ED9519|nr:LITAF-like zinc ribbon domain-containing protein [Neorhizobium sp. P12A]
MATCHFCETEIPDGLSICPHCGKPQLTRVQKRQQIVGILICLGIFVMAAVAATLLNGATPRL